MLREGMALTHEEFRRRYEKSNCEKVELVNGKVRMPSPVHATKHSIPHHELGFWLGAYKMDSPNVQVGDNGTVKLDDGNEYQPDLLMRKKDGTCQLGEDDYFYGPPELVVEISNTSLHLDTGEKKEVYRRHGVKEYIIWKTQMNEIDWFVLRNEEYQKIEAVDQVITSETFPGLALNVAAVLEGNSSQVFQTLRNAMAEE